MKNLEISNLQKKSETLSKVKRLLGKIPENDKEKLEKTRVYPNVGDFSLEILVAEMSALGLLWDNITFFFHNIAHTYQTSSKNDKKTSTRFQKKYLFKLRKISH